VTATAVPGVDRSWISGAVVALLAHAVVLVGLRITVDVPPPALEVDLTVSDMARPPPPPPEPPAEVVAPRARASVARVTAQAKQAPAPRDDAPPPPSNRPPPPDASSEPVPIITGVSIPVLEVKGVLVRQGNTDVPGFDPPEDMKPGDVRGYAGGVIGGSAKQSGGTGEPGPGIGGGKRLSQLTKMPRVIKRYKPPYPRELRDSDVEGKVLLRVQVLASGKTGEVKLVRGSHPLLDQLAVSAVKRFVWAPGEIHGKPVTAWVRHTFRFELY
jgi:protein TonB